jgi:RecB family endonuclease NucS
VYTAPVTNVVPSEANLRDQLVARLDLIEYGLHDPITEYPLRIDHGTRGRVDILARDRHGRRVVIEVKRSKKATREALHEVGKYMELLSRAEGYSADRILGHLRHRELMRTCAPWW